MDLIPPLPLRGTSEREGDRTREPSKRRPEGRRRREAEKHRARNHDGAVRTKRTCRRPQLREAEHEERRRGGDEEDEAREHTRLEARPYAAPEAIEAVRPGGQDDGSGTAEQRPEHRPRVAVGDERVEEEEEAGGEASGDNG